MLGAMPVDPESNLQPLDAVEAVHRGGEQFAGHIPFPASPPIGVHGVGGVEDEEQAGHLVFGSIALRQNPSMPVPWGEMKEGEKQDGEPLAVHQ